MYQWLRLSFGVQLGSWQLPSYCFAYLSVPYILKMPTISRACIFSHILSRISSTSPSLTSTTVDNGLIAAENNRWGLSVSSKEYSWWFSETQDCFSTINGKVLPQKYGDWRKKLMKKYGIFKHSLEIYSRVYIIGDAVNEIIILMKALDDSTCCDFILLHHSKYHYNWLPISITGACAEISTRGHCQFSANFLVFFTENRDRIHCKLFLKKFSST